MAKEEEKKFDILDNRAIDTLNDYCRVHKNYPTEYKEERQIVCDFNYGKAKIKACYLYADKAAITDVLFDLRDVYEKYGKDWGSYSAFLNVVQVTLPSYYRRIEGWVFTDETDKVEALARPVAGMTTQPFNKYCVWALAVKEICEAIDKANKLSYCTITPEEVDGCIVKANKKSYNIFIGVAALGLALGITLIILSILGTINKVAGWIFGVLFTVVFLFLFITWIIGRKETIQNYLQNKADNEFFTADYSRL